MGRRRTGRVGRAARHAPIARSTTSSRSTATAYLPRKFKIAVAWPGDNCVDIYTNDVGVVPTLSNGTTGELTGYVVFAGGGMGMSHSRPDDTYPLLAQPVAWVPPDDVVDVVEAIVTTQRDHGDRDDRSGPV